MRVVETQIAEWKHAYQMLGVPLDSSSHSIKQAYRTLCKRWHPDRCASGAAAREESTRMMALINDAYDKIQHAPLRYFADANPQPTTRTREEARTAAYRTRSAQEQAPPINTDRIEFWVRFMFGSVVGALLSLRLLLWLYESPRTLVVSIVALILGLGFASARFGDKAWHFGLRSWWLWW
jgi:hypothetical protein